MLYQMVNLQIEYLEGVGLLCLHMTPRVARAKDEEHSPVETTIYGTRWASRDIPRYYLLIIYTFNVYTSITDHAVNTVFRYALPEVCNTTILKYHSLNANVPYECRKKCLLVSLILAIIQNK